MKKKKISAHWIVAPIEDKVLDEGQGYLWTGCEMEKEKIRQFCDSYYYQAKLVENISDSVISVDLDLNIVTWNKAAEEIYGYTLEEVKGRHLANFVEYEFLDDSMDNARQQLFNSGIWQGEVAFLRKDGLKVYLFSSVSLIKDENGNPYGLVAVNRNITDKKKERSSTYPQREVVVCRRFCLEPTIN